MANAAPRAAPAGSFARKFAAASDDGERAGRRAFDRTVSLSLQRAGGKRERQRMSIAAEPARAAEGGELSEAEKICLRANRMLVSGETEDAFDLYCDVLAIDSWNVKALSALAVLNHKRGLFDTARTLYQRCLSADPTRPKTNYNLGRLEHECKNHGKARDLYRTTREMIKQEMKPDDETLCSSLAYEGLLLQEEFGDDAAAAKCYEESLARNPKHARTLCHKCALLERRGQPQEAKQLHATVLQLHPEHAETWCPYSNSLFSGDLIDVRQARCGALPRAHSPGQAL
jgi:tetratricopeptide (TPR) repeat protein